MEKLGKPSAQARGSRERALEMESIMEFIIGFCYEGGVMTLSMTAPMKEKKCGPGGSISYLYLYLASLYKFS